MKLSDRLNDSIKQCQKEDLIELEEFKMAILSASVDRSEANILEAEIKLKAATDKLNIAWCDSGKEWKSLGWWFRFWTNEDEFRNDWCRLEREEFRREKGRFSAINILDGFIRAVVIPTDDSNFVPQAPASPKKMTMGDYDDLLK